MAYDQTIACCRGSPGRAVAPGSRVFGRAAPFRGSARAWHIRGEPRCPSARIPGRVAVKPMPREGQEETDATLVATAVAGDAAAKRALFERHAPMVNRLARRLLGPGVEVDDLVQDVFVEALLGLAQLKNGQAFQAWLGSIVVRTAHKRRRRRRLLERLGLRRREPLDLDGFCSPTAPPDVAVELRAIYGLLYTLPVEVHVALVLRRVEGLSIEEIAERMRLSVSTVKRRLAAAETRLETWMRAEEDRA